VDKFEVLSNKHNEMRYLAIGEIENHVIAVVYTIRHDNYRIISARKASRQERKNYEEYCYSQIK